jgi:hypothetical protein
MAQTEKAATLPIQTERSAPTTGTATVIIGCRLPSGITLEVGLQTREKNSDGKLVTMVKRLDNYERIVLKGWHYHNTTGLQMPAGMQSERPYLNRGVSKAAWEQWKLEHAGSWLLKNNILFEADSEAEAQGKAIDFAKAPTILAPIKLTKDGKPIVDGKPVKDVETAEFQPGVKKD